MKIVCAWCKKPMGEKEPFEDKSVSHGMCPECYKKQMGEEPMESLKEKAEREIPDAMHAAERAIASAAICDSRNMFFNMMAFYLEMSRSMADFDEVKEIIAQTEQEVIQKLGTSCGCKFKR